MRCGHGHVKRQHFQDEVLHAKHLFLGVRVVRNVHKFVHLRGVDLLVLPEEETAMDGIRFGTTGAVCQTALTKKKTSKQKNK